MRINQYLARYAGLSRRSADDAIAAGRVLVDGRLAQIGQQVETETITLDDKTITPKSSRYVVFNKPAGLVCSRRRQGNNPTIYDRLPAEFQDLKPVGRLDKDSSGLLVLTNDGQLAQRLGHPSSGKVKVYKVELDRALSEADADQLRRGMELEDGISRLDISGRGQRLTVRLTEGRNRQIRRSFEAAGYKVVGLERTAFGKLTLDLPSGSWRAVQPEELE